MRRGAQSAVFALALVGTGLQLASGTALAALQAAGLGSDLRRNALAVATTEYGGRWVASTLLSVALTFFLSALWRQARQEGVAGIASEFRRLGLWALLMPQARVILLVLAQAAVSAVSGHAASSAGLTPFEVLIRGLHLLAMGVWVGGVLALVYIWAVIPRARKEFASSFRALMFGFGPFAVVSFAILGLTGLVLAGAQVASVTALLSTSYGAVLIAKVVAIGAVAAIALRHVLVVNRSWKSIRSGIPPTLAIEGAGAVAVVLLAAVLSSSAPARGPQFEPPAAASSTLMTRQSGELVASVTVKPNQEGPNLISVRVVDERRPSLAPIDGVIVLLKRPGGAGAQAFETTRTGSLFDAGTVRLATGDVGLGVVIRRRGVADTAIDMPWRVNPAAIKPAPVIISAAPLAPVVNLFVAGVVVASLFGVVAGLIRYRWGRARPSYQRKRRVEEVIAIEQARR
jgi:putative copper export protein